MANLVGIVTPSGFGKSTSIGKNEELGIAGLDPTETAIINVKSKPLPFRGWKNQYKGKISEKGNYAEIADTREVMNAVTYISSNRPDIKVVVIDDFQYLMAEQFMADALKSGFEKFSKLGKYIYDLLTTCSKVREDLTIIVLAHSEETKHGSTESYKLKTIGKMLDEKVTLEGLFTILLYGKSSFDNTEKKTKKEFVTNYDGEFPAKSPHGMFSDLYINNDLGLVVKKIKEYNEG